MKFSNVIFFLISGAATSTVYGDQTPDQPVSLEGSLDEPSAAELAEEELFESLATLDPDLVDALNPENPDGFFAESGGQLDVASLLLRRGDSELSDGELAEEQLLEQLADLDPGLFEPPAEEFEYTEDELEVLDPGLLAMIQLQQEDFNATDLEGLEGDDHHRDLTSWIPGGRGQCVANFHRCGT